MTDPKSHTENTDIREKIFGIVSRVFVWSLVVAALYLLRDFFLLIFLTFVFAYIQVAGVRRLQNVISNRPLRVTLVGIIFLAVLMVLGAIIVPRVQEQARIFVDRLPTYLRKIDSEIVVLRSRYAVLENFLPSATNGNIISPDDPSWSPAHSPTAHFLQEILGFGESEEAGASAKHTLSVIQKVVGKVLGSISSFFLALLFSFLIVLDLERLTRSVQGLRNTHLSFIYEEVAGGMYDFGRIMGQALGAQLFIALANTALTALLVILLGIGDKLAFLSTIVFLCSFIPVAGVFISSVPICLIVLQDSGFGMVLLTALAIWILHLVEAYILNPRIFGHHLRINPVLVLIILTIGGKLFGVWGLVLGVPVSTYVFGHAIRAPHDR